MSEDGRGLPSLLPLSESESILRSFIANISQPELDHFDTPAEWEAGEVLASPM